MARELESARSSLRDSLATRFSPVEPAGGDSHLHLAGGAGPRPPIVEPRPGLGNAVNQLRASDAQGTRGGDVTSQSKEE